MKNIIRLSGGLGNQMFQCAFAEFLKKKTGKGYIFDGSSYSKDKLRHYELDIYENPTFRIGTIIKNLVKVLCRLGVFQEYREKELFQFDNNVVNRLGLLTYFNGYWQSYFYCDPVKTQLIKLFEPAQPPSSLNQKLAGEIEQSESVSLHVRRGDYIKNSEANGVHGTCSLNYYNKAVEYMNQRIQNPQYYIFSDDPDWVRSSMKLDCNSKVISHNTGNQAYWDIWLMKRCKHNIIANSTFSWWGAYLSTYSDKIVIAPEKWNNLKLGKMELIPKSWVKLS